MGEVRDHHQAEDQVIEDPPQLPVAQGVGHQFSQTRKRARPGAGTRAARSVHARPRAAVAPPPLARSAR